MESIQTGIRIETRNHYFKILKQLDAGCYAASMTSPADDSKECTDVILIDKEVDLNKEYVIASALKNAEPIEKINYRQSVFQVYPMTERLRTAFGYFEDGRLLGDWFKAGNGIFWSFEDRKTVDGPGIYRLNDGYVYEGNFVNGRLEGEGRIKNGVNVVYEGALRNGVYHGEGVLYYDDGRVYSGSFVNGKREGRGALTTPYGDYYIGEFKNDCLTGNGEYFTEDGQKCTYIDLTCPSEIKRKFMMHKYYVLGTIVLLIGIILLCLIGFGFLFYAGSVRSYLMAALVIGYGLSLIMKQQAYNEKIETERVYFEQFK